MSGRNIKLFFIIGILFLFVVASCSKKEERLKLPSEVLSQVWDSIMPAIYKGEVSDRFTFSEKQKEFTRKLIDSMVVTNLDEDEQISCAKVYARAWYFNKAESILGRFVSADGERARKALALLITFKTEQKKIEEARKLIAEFRERFPASPDFLRGLYDEVVDLVDMLNLMDKQDEAIEVLMDELNSLSFDAPYFSFYCIEELFPLMAEKGRVNRLYEIADSLKAGLEFAYKAYMDTVTYSDSATAEKDNIAKDYTELLKYLDRVKERANLIGKVAPELKFAHVYNADSTSSFRVLMGKVTILDFWTTWCLPCVIGFRELAELLGKYGDDGLRVISVTTFQGFFSDRETGYSEGSPDSTICRAREIELTGNYIKRHGVTWPVAFLDDKEYTRSYLVSGYPTYIVIDKSGIIRYFQLGIGKKKQMERIIKGLI